MTSDPQISNLPAQIADAISGVPKALIPASIKALDRLVGAAVDIPVAWLGQKKAKIDAQTQAYAAVELAISNAVSTEASATPEIIQQAMSVLVRKEYRKQINRNAVGQAALEDLRSTDSESVPPETREAVDDDWLNIFERYAEDASTERMQKLWGRVLAGEIRKSGSYSMRTLRFLSEFSQVDALTFAEFCESAFADSAPKKLAIPEEGKDIRSLLYLESSGLIKGVEGLGLERSITFRDNGYAITIENGIVLLFKGEPNSECAVKILALTPLGQELLSLLPARDPRAVARRVAEAYRQPAIKAAYLAKATNGEAETSSIEILWEDSLDSIDSEEK
jgi:hypothetical protein